MNKTEIQKQQQKELHKQIWDVANSFWGKMEADDYKDYVLGLLFYRYLSEKIEKRSSSMLKHDNISYARAWESEEYRQPLIEDLINELGFVIEPQYLFSHMIYLILTEKTGFDVEYLQKAINSLIESTLGQSSQDAFDNIFDDFDLSSSKLGKSVSDRNSLISTALVSISKINFDHEDAQIDILGDAYEYLIGQFAAGAGKKSGAFYTPAQAGNLLSRLTNMNGEKVKNAYDGCGGSASLLLHVGQRAEVANYYYQELTTNTYNLARMNMLLHNVGYEKMHMQNDDTLVHPDFLDVSMDVIVANPPYSQKWSADDKYLSDERFAEFGVLPPKSYADFAFVLSMLHMLKPTGAMAILLPHGVLFRGGKEGAIRKKLIEKQRIDAVIGLPDNVFYGTSIPVICLVLRKDKTDGNILFVDASKDFIKEGNKNFIPDSAIDKIVDCYANKSNIEKYSHLATIDEIVENDYNLNIPRYVDTFEEEAPVDIGFHQAELLKETQNAAELEKEIMAMMQELVETGEAHV